MMILFRNQNEIRKPIGRYNDDNMRIALFRIPRR